MLNLCPNKGLMGSLHSQAVYCCILLGPLVVKVWIVGHRIVFWAGRRTADISWHKQLALREIALVEWLGRNGMRWATYNLPPIFFPMTIMSNCLSAIESHLRNPWAWLMKSNATITSDHKRSALTFIIIAKRHCHRLFSRGAPYYVSMLFYQSNLEGQERVRLILIWWQV